ncbi:IucA/IucC family siderophore biosynthesis protein [Paenibacillus sp. L3-i20]|uniref:IucA/IucC family protein n=1 Tax=Paenibacillus sp. L3-i20 TaxID=2905833 RepID=UPI002084CBBB|nr:IucA/IucC family protein [Paenibacillus sp. L3-i20]GKU76663.1 siderophore biosynthesis protein [Paenibacillus sp. L3-i20]
MNGVKLTLNRTGYADTMSERSQRDSVESAICGPQYKKVRQRILRQLIEALLFEKVLPAQKVPLENKTQFILGVTDHRGKEITYICSGSERYTFGRIRLDEGPVFRIEDDKRAEVDSLSLFLLDAASTIGGDQSLVIAFIHELEQTLLNDVLAQQTRMEESELLSECSYDELEGAVMDGHLYHPSYKSRLGFDFEEQYRYGPEFRAEIKPIWLAVHKHNVTLSSSANKSPDWIVEELGSQQLKVFYNVLDSRGLKPENYALMPVHPWQWKHRIIPYYHTDIHNELIVKLGESEDGYRPQQSIRTLTNTTHPEKAYLKLSMNIINTSTGRVLAPHTVANAPLISDWLSSIVESDRYLHDELKLSILEEYIGASYQSTERSDQLASFTYGSLGCIWRTSLHTKLRSGEEACAFTALCALSADGTPFIQKWIGMYGIDVWVQQLLEKSIVPIIHLLYGHGIAFESHAQNLILIHEAGLPTRIAMKDFHDGIRFSRKHLANPEGCPNLHVTPDAHTRVNRNSFIETEDTENIKDLVLGAFFFINLGEIAIFLADKYGYSEQKFWKQARAIIIRYQEQFPKWNDRYNTFNLLSPTNELEQLAKRRLFADSELRVHQVRNSLSYKE